MKLNVGDRVVLRNGLVGTIAKLCTDEWVNMESSDSFVGCMLIDRDVDVSEIVEKIRTATEKQISYLVDLGYAGDASKLTVEQASSEIDHLKQYVGKMECHYCGGPASGFGFFDEPACGQCGGRD